MPIGVICNCIGVAVGGLAGAALQSRLSERFRGELTMVLGMCAFAMSVPAMAQVKNLPAVILAIVLGTVIGLALHLGERLNRGVEKILGGSGSAELVTIIVLFCASGTGIYGSLVEGMTGDASILLSKTVLDFVTAMAFACTLGRVVALISIPQFVIMIALFLLTGLIYPHTTPGMIADFKACGALITAASGFRILKLKQLPTVDMIPAMVLILPLSWLWSTYIAPLL